MYDLSFPHLFGQDDISVQGVHVITLLSHIADPSLSYLTAAVLSINSSVLLLLKIWWVFTRLSHTLTKLTLVLTIHNSVSLHSLVVKVIAGFTLAPLYLIILYSTKVNPNKKHLLEGVNED